MSGTISSPFTLMNTQLVDNTSQLILPLNARNVAESMAGVPTSTQAASFSPAVTDRGTVIRCNFASAGVVTINTGVFSAGHQIGLRWVGAGSVAIAAGAGVTLIPTSPTLRAVGSVAFVTADTVANTFFVDGDLA